MDLPGYITAKAGVEGLTRTLAREYGPWGVRVNCIIPGWIMTEKQLAEWVTPEAEAVDRPQPVPAAEALPRRRRSHAAVVGCGRLPLLHGAAVGRGRGLDVSRATRVTERCTFHGEGVVLGRAEAAAAARRHARGRRRGARAGPRCRYGTSTAGSPRSIRRRDRRRVRARGRARLPVPRRRASSRPATAVDVFDDPSIRMNEGGCDPQGRLHVGTMAYDVATGRGTVYRLDADRSVTPVLDRGDDLERPAVVRRRRHGVLRRHPDGPRVAVPLRPGRRHVPRPRAVHRPVGRRRAPGRDDDRRGRRPVGRDVRRLGGAPVRRRTARRRRWSSCRRAT